METLVLFSLAALCFYLAFDAWRIAVPGREVPLEVDFEGTHLVRGMSNVKREELKQVNLRFGIGDPSQSVWLWALIGLGCTVAGFYSLYLRTMQ